MSGQENTGGRPRVRNPGTGKGIFSQILCLSGVVLSSCSGIVWVIKPIGFGIQVFQNNLTF